MIFAVGMPKTGTTSLGRALEMLGYKVPHHSYHIESRRRRLGLYSENLVGGVDAIVMAWPWSYHILDEQFPGSQFILTTRDEDAWVESIKNHFARKPDRFNVFGRLDTFGMIQFNDSWFRHLYRMHHRSVVAHFPQSSRLLIHTVGEDGWVSLCNFLGKDVPRTPYPHLNKSS